MINMGYWMKRGFPRNMTMEKLIQKGWTLREATQEEIDFYCSDKWDAYEKASYPEDIVDEYRFYWED
jgi:hypothetical protein